MAFDGGGSIGKVGVGPQLGVSKRYVPPPGGEDGVTYVRDYPAVLFRCPPRVREELRSLAESTGQAQWRLIVKAWDFWRENS